MMRLESCEEELNVNIVVRSGITIGDDKGKKPKESVWVHKDPTKEPKFNLAHVKETFMEAKKIFMEASTSGSKDQLEMKMDPSMITTFLGTCIKLLHDRKAMKGLQELNTRCAGLGEPHVVWKLGKHTSRIGREMQLTTQIKEYEMDQVIMDLGSVANVLPKQTWECMGRPTSQWSPIQL